MTVWYKGPVYHVLLDVLGTVAAPRAMQKSDEEVTRWACETKQRDGHVFQDRALASAKKSDCQGNLQVRIVGCMTSRALNISTPGDSL